MSCTIDTSVYDNPILAILDGTLTQSNALSYGFTLTQFAMLAAAAEEFRGYDIVLVETGASLSKTATDVRKLTVVNGSGATVTVGDFPVLTGTTSVFENFSGIILSAGGGATTVKLYHQGGTIVATP